ncbi:MAG: hypothetical protein K8I29_20190 [Alphaproteobacteria bacterium]|uniref:Surface-adhesin protein E-like domain-containing protein n=1 Tax=Candidatus Nitrobium versatile TaxID=2884831 RepID=A0A953M3X5_9BACT|nr:hypothetical protein [Candidatus Nitrobium versatile]
MFGDDQYTVSYYNRKSVRVSPDGTVRLWTKSVVKGKKGREYYTHVFGEKYTSFEYGKALIEIDCNNKKLRSITAEDYDKSDTLIGSTSSPVEGLNIVPDMVVWNLYEKFCSKRKK